MKHNESKDCYILSLILLPCFLFLSWHPNSYWKLLSWLSILSRIFMASFGWRQNVQGAWNVSFSRIGCKVGWVFKCGVILIWGQMFIHSNKIISEIRGERGEKPSYLSLVEFSNGKLHFMHILQACSIGLFYLLHWITGLFDSFDLDNRSVHFSLQVAGVGLGCIVGRNCCSSCAIQISEFACL